MLRIHEHRLTRRQPEQRRIVARDVVDETGPASHYFAHRRDRVENSSMSHRSSGTTDTASRPSVNRSQNSAASAPPGSAPHNRPLQSRVSRSRPTSAQHVVDAPLQHPRQLALVQRVDLFRGIRVAAGAALPAGIGTPLGGANQPGQ